MPIPIMSKADVEGTIARSRSRVATQAAVVAGLERQGQADLADRARDLLVAMHRHLAMEIELLARMPA